MANKKITDLSALSSGDLVDSDVMEIVDLSEASTSDQNKKITIANLVAGEPIKLTSWTAFTPTSGAGPAFTSIDARYMRAFNVVFIYMDFTWNAAEASGAGNVVIDLPVAAANAGGLAGILNSGGYTTANLEILTGTTTGQIITNGATQPAYSALASDRFVFMGLYEVA